MSIFKNEEYIKYIKTSQYAKILLENILTNGEKKKKLEDLIKVYFLRNVEATNIQIKKEDLMISYTLLNISNIDKDYISKITNNPYYYDMVLNIKYEDFFSLNNLNKIQELSSFFICEISISEKIPNKSLKLNIYSNKYLGLFHSQNNYKGYFIVQLSEISGITNILYNSFKAK